MACTAHRTLALLLTLTACGDDGSEDSSFAGATLDSTVTPPQTDPPTSEPTSSTGGEPGTTTSDDSTSTSTSTPGDDTTTNSDESTGPICDPGQPNCVCDNGLCIDGYVCTGGTCMASTACDGDVEVPGEGEDQPTPLDDISDDDDEFHQVPGILSGAMDIDWYRYHGADTFGHTAEPTIELLTMSAGMRVCQFIECDAGGVALTKLTCPDGTKFAISGDLRPGCCHSAGFTISDFDCDGQDESVQVFLRLDKPAEDTCVDYEFKTHF